MQIDINNALVGITLLIATVIFFFQARKSPLLYGPKGKPKPVSNQKISELEVRIKLNSDASVLEDMVELIQLFRKANRYAEAERYCRQALAVGEGEGGKDNPILIPILNEYANVLTGMRRKVEADKLKERAKKIESQSR